MPAQKPLSRRTWPPWTQMFRTPRQNTYRGPKNSRSTTRASGKAMSAMLCHAPRKAAASQRAADRTARPARIRGVFARKAKGVQPVAHLSDQGQGAHKGAQAVHMTAGTALEPVPAQQAAALDVGPGGPHPALLLSGEAGRGKARPAAPGSSRQSKAWFSFR